MKTLMVSRSDEQPGEGACRAPSSLPSCGLWESSLWDPASAMFVLGAFRLSLSFFFLSFCFSQTRSGYQPELYSVGLEKPDWVQGWTGLVLETGVGPGGLDLT